MATVPPVDASSDAITEAPVPIEPHVAGLGPRFLGALKLRVDGRVDDAIEAFRDILKAEPRLAEPRVELGRIYLEMGRLDEAEAEAREGLRILEAGGQWTDDLPENVVLALAFALVGEILKERATSDEVVFGPEETFRALLEESRRCYARASELDPSDSASFMNALEMAEQKADRAEMTGDIEDEDANEGAPGGEVEEFGEG
jgi:tetratricopeptide (TPR) repeat protein